MNSNITEHINDASIIWQGLPDAGYSPEKPLAIDFGFYSTNKTKAFELFTFLKETVSSEIKIYSRRTLLIFKGWSIQLTIEHVWTLNELKSVIVYLVNTAAEYHCIMEEFGALISDKNRQKGSSQE